MANAKVITTHSQIRALYHYGIKMSFTELMQAQDDIRGGKALLLKKIDKRSSVYETITQGVKMLAVYDMEIKRIRTFYKKSYLRPKKQKRRKPRDGREHARQRGRRRRPEEDFHAEL